MDRLLARRTHCPLAPSPTNQSLGTRPIRHPSQTYRNFPTVWVPRGIEASRSTHKPDAQARDQPKSHPPSSTHVAELVRDSNAFLNARFSSPRTQAFSRNRARLADELCNWLERQHISP